MKIKNKLAQDYTDKFMEMDVGTKRLKKLPLSQSLLLQAAYKAGFDKARELIASGILVESEESVERVGESVN